SWRKLRRRKSIRQAGTNCNCRLTEREEEMNKKLSMLGVTLLALGSMAWAASQAEKATKAATAEKTYYAAVSDSNCGLKHATAGSSPCAGDSNYLLRHPEGARGHLMRWPFCFPREASSRKDLGQGEPLKRTCVSGATRESLWPEARSGSLAPDDLNHHGTRLP